MPSNDTTALNDILARSAAARADKERRYARLWRMTVEERIAAMWRGDLTFGECLAWSARRPQEVPLIGGEFAYIVMRTPEWLED